MPKATMGSPKLLPQTSCPQQESYCDAGSCLVSTSCMRPPAEPAAASEPLKDQDHLSARNQQQISDLGLKIKNYISVLTKMFVVKRLEVVSFFHFDPA